MMLSNSISSTRGNSKDIFSVNVADDSGMHLSFDESTSSCLRDDNNNDPTFIPHIPKSIVETNSENADVSENELEDLSLTELSDASIHQWYISQQSIDVSEDIDASKIEEEKALTTVLKGASRLGGLKWEQVAVLYLANGHYMPIETLTTKFAEEYLESFPFVRCFTDGNNRKRFHLTDDPLPPTFNPTRDRNLSSYSSCNSSWGAQTVADFDLTLGDKNPNDEVFITTNNDDKL
ncbi:hypothetical protein FO519_000283 [Halicephalobus sp. NKZ332]|nr:hypothetical protein FO519_000283 [Halicephalobus sp. NKZ332]